MLHQAQETLQNEQQRGQQQEAELAESKAVLEKEKRRVKRIWREKCDLQLSHEDAIDAKDVEIARLKARLLIITSPAAVSPQTVPSPGDRRVDETSLVPLQHITIMGGKLFKEVANVAQLRKRDFRPADKIPHTYNQQPFNLHRLGNHIWR